MSYPNRINLFASEFYRLACELSDHPETPLAVECRDHLEAFRLRTQFYAFRKAARKHRDEGDMDHFKNIDFIEVLIPKDANGRDGRTVIFQDRDASQVAHTLKDALDKREQALGGQNAGQ